jgi:hypothetical protein
MSGHDQSEVNDERSLRWSDDPRGSAPSEAAHQMPDLTFLASLSPQANGDEWLMSYWVMGPLTGGGLDNQEGSEG